MWSLSIGSMKREPDKKVSAKDDCNKKNVLVPRKRSFIIGLSENRKCREKSPIIGEVFLHFIVVQVWDVPFFKMLLYTWQYDLALHMEPVEGGYRVGVVFRVQVIHLIAADAAVHGDLSVDVCGVFRVQV